MKVELGGWPKTKKQKNGRPALLLSNQHPPPPGKHWLKNSKAWSGKSNTRTRLSLFKSSSKFLVTTRLTPLLMLIVSIPEELKNAVCCLKCRRVNVEHSSEKVQNNKVLRRCSVCDGYCYIYNEFKSGISILLKMGLYILFPTAVGLYFSGAPLRFIFWWNFSVTLLFLVLVYIENRQKRAMAKLLKEQCL